MQALFLQTGARAERARPAALQQPEMAAAVGAGRSLCFIAPLLAADLERCRPLAARREAVEVAAVLGPMEEPSHIK